MAVPRFDCAVARNGPAPPGYPQPPSCSKTRTPGKLESVYEDLSRERSRFEDAREEIERLRQELHRIEVERLRIDAATSRRLAQVLAEVGARRDGRSATGSVS